MNKIILIVAVLGLMLCACNEKRNSESKTQPSTQKPKVDIPDFNADSAYFYVKSQVDFGPRVPNTNSHTKCAEYLFSKLKSFADTAMVQSFKTKAFDGTVLNSKNIIGVFNPDKQKRVLLCSHWDSRPFADHDPDPSLQNTPIDGANDGASGIGVLLELARLMAISKPEIGIDIIFFDVEDYGPPKNHPNSEVKDQYGLGSQYWSKNPHDPDYTADYGILLDMVGASNARFYMEGFSMEYASGILKKVWSIANRAGFSEYFVFDQVGYIDDDHKYINEIAKIPTIDIIHLDPESSNGSFFEYWHTTGDNLSVIDKQTLKVVGQTLLNVVFQEK
jgi:Zn-dependent M28 family amino/carboxypeptidase